MDDKPKQITGKYLNKRWNVGVKQALYRENGTWYHKLQRFPGALFDRHGYIVFENKQEMMECQQLQIGKQISARYGISNIPGYVRVTDEQVQLIGQLEQNEDSLSERIRKSINSSFSEQEKFVEGGIQEVTLELRKRNPKLKFLAIEKYGENCQVCGFNFGEFYGEIGEGYIELHHLEPLSNRYSEAETSVEDVALVCANCHRILHRNGAKPLSITELQKSLKSYSKR